MELKVLGSGCANCKHLLQMVEYAVKKNSIEASIEYVTDLRRIASCNIMRTPALMKDGMLLVSGRVPSLKEIEDWLFREVKLT